MQDARYSSTVSGKLGVEAHRKRALEMLSMRPIVDPVAGDLFHGGDRFSVADDRREVSMAARLDPHTEAVSALWKVTRSTMPASTSPQG
jgi:hypothetical protein